MATATGPEAPERARIPFLGRRHRKVQIVLAIVTAGLYLLVPLTVWLWRTGRRRGAYASGALSVILVIAIGAGANGGNKTGKPPKSAAPASTKPKAMSTSTRAAADTRAKATIARALKLVASNYQDFGDYVLVSTFTLGNLDHSLRSVTGFAVRGQGKTFSLSVRSASGTTFMVHGDHLQLSRSCAPAGAAQGGIGPEQAVLCCRRFPLSQPPTRSRSVRS